MKVGKGANLSALEDTDEMESEYEIRYAFGGIRGGVGVLILWTSSSQHRPADHTNSPYNNDTLIFVIEDDAQDGGDHVDAHRSVAFVVGPYVKQGAVVPTSYNTISMFRTIEDILGTEHQNLNDALALPMADVFDRKQKDWTFSATPSGLLCGDTLLDLPPTACQGVAALYPTHNAAYWAAVTKDMDFSVEDHVDGAEFNRILWQGLMGSKPYPATPSGLDLRANRQQLLERYRTNLQQQSVRSDESPAPSGGGGQ